MVSIGSVNCGSKICGLLTFDGANILIDPFNGPIDNLGISINDHLIHNLHWLYLDLILITKPISVETISAVTNGYDISSTIIIGTSWLLNLLELDDLFSKIVKLSFEESYVLEFEYATKRHAKYPFITKPLKLEFIAHSSGYSLGSGWYEITSLEKNEKLAIITPICKSTLFKTPSINSLSKCRIILPLTNDLSCVKNEVEESKDLLDQLVKKCQNETVTTIETDVLAPSLLYFLVSFFNHSNKISLKVYILGDVVKKFFNLLNQSCEWVSDERSELPMDSTNPQSPFHDLTKFIGSNLFLCNDLEELNNIFNKPAIVIKHNESNDAFKNLIPQLTDIKFEKSQKIYKDDELDYKFQEIPFEWCGGNFQNILRGKVPKQRTLLKTTISTLSESIIIDDSQSINWGLDYNIANLNKLAKALGGTVDPNNNKITLKDCIVTIHSANAAEIHTKNPFLRRKITQIVENFK